MRPEEPFVTILTACYADGDVAGSPDVFRLPITLPVMEEILGLQRFFSEINVSLDAKFPGKSLGYLDLPFDRFYAEGEDEDSAGVDTRLEGQALRVRADGVFLIAKMRVARAGLASDRLTNVDLELKFMELRELVLATSTQEAIGEALGLAEQGIAPARRPCGPSL
jgi:hypothetical protein